MKTLHASTALPLLICTTAFLQTACSKSSGTSPSSTVSAPVAAPAAPPESKTFPDGTPRQNPEFQAIVENCRKNGSTELFPWRRVPELEASLKNPGLPPDKRIVNQAELARVYIQLGDTDNGVKAIEAAFAAVNSIPGAKMSPAFHWMRGLVYLRHAEVQNCINHRNADCCVFPLKGGGVHALNEPAQQSRASYMQYLQSSPNDAARVVWMLNVLSMAIGDYPQGVPEQLRLPEAAFESEYDIKKFRDLAPKLGLDHKNLAGGAMAGDFDNDGILDIAISDQLIVGPMSYFRNDGKGGFENRSTESRLDDQLGGLNAVQVDYNNDGNLDILVLRGGWWQFDGRIRKSLLKNNGGGVFTDVTRAAGLADPAMPTQTAAWADFNNDGFLDVFVGNESNIEAGDTKNSYPCQLYRNNGDGTFTDIARAAGVTNDRYTKGVAAGDYDNDGYMDLYVSNLLKNRLYHNNGNMTFTDVTEQFGVSAPDGRSFACWFFDYDNDGWLDIFCNAYDATIIDVAMDYMGRPFAAAPPALYHNEGGKKFVNVAVQMGLNHPYLPMGANYGDLDNDGWLDIYLGTGGPDFELLMPNVLLRNDAGRKWQNVTKSAGVGYLQKGHGIAFADFDNDGDQDIFHEMGGLLPGDAYFDVLLENPGHGNHFLSVDVQGTKTNRCGIGARLKVTVSTPSGPREIHRDAGCVSSFGGSPLSRIPIGLGDATAITKLEIFWPVSKTTQVFENVPLDVFIKAVEGQPEFERLNLPAIKFE